MIQINRIAALYISKCALLIALLAILSNNLSLLVETKAIHLEQPNMAKFDTVLDAKIDPKDNVKLTVNELEQYLRLRRRIQCQLNGNLCNDENQLPMELVNDNSEQDNQTIMPIEKRSACLSGAPSSNCENSKNDKEDLVDHFDHSYKNPGK